MNPVWPTPLEEQLLLASFAPEEAASAALQQCLKEWPQSEPDPATTHLLPLVYRRWQAVEGPLIDLGRRAYLATWKRNRERMAQLVELGARFNHAGIRWMALKGAALAIRQYADLGLRVMSDVDILIQPEDLGRVVPLLGEAGFRADENASSEAILRQSRVRHAWQFFGQPDWNFDLHSRPVSRCSSPDVARLFWDGAEVVPFGEGQILVPSPTSQLFHVSVHGLQWDWTRTIRWIPDALTTLRDPMDWDLVGRLAGWANMSFRLATALEFLRQRFEAPIPRDVTAGLFRAAPPWEEREFRLLLKPCPLGLRDSLAWHSYHFRRIRRFDEDWRRKPLSVAFPQYVAAFLDASGVRSLWLKLRPQLKLRFGRG